MEVNGMKVPIAGAIAVLTFTFWLGTLSIAVADNSEEISKQSDTKERLARIEVSQEAQKEDIQEIKEAQKEQSKKLDKILEKVSE